MREAPPTQHPVWGEGVKFLRTLAGLTQTELAEKVGTTQSRISMLENGSPVLVRDDLRVRIAATLGVEAHDLFPYPETGDAA